MTFVFNYRIFNECGSSPNVIISLIYLNHIFIKLAAEDIIISKKILSLKVYALISILQAHINDTLSPYVFMHLCT